MATKKYKLPDKIADLPAVDFGDIVKNPGSYGLNMREFMEFMDYMAKTYAPFMPNNSSNEIESLKKEIEYLKLENRTLEAQLEAARRSLNKAENVFSEIEHIAVYWEDDEEIEEDD